MLFVVMLSIIGLVFLFGVIGSESQKNEVRKYERLYDNAFRLFNEGKFNEALKMFLTAVDEKPNFYRGGKSAWRKVGECYFYCRKYNDVIRHFLSDNSEDSLYYKAISFAELGLYSEANENINLGKHLNLNRFEEIYKRYFNPDKSKIEYWNSLSDDTKCLLLENVNIHSKNSLKLDEETINKIIECKYLDLSYRKDDWTWDSEDQMWISKTVYSKYKIETIEFCKYLKKIEKLNISGQAITSFKGLENQITLTEIDASFTKVQSLDELKNLKKLVQLNMYGDDRYNDKHHYLDLKPISELNIEKLDIGYARVKDFSFLNKISSLKELSLYRSNVSSLLELSNLSKLEELIVSFSKDFKLNTSYPALNLKTLKLYDEASTSILSDFKIQFPECAIVSNHIYSDIFNKRPTFNPDYLEYFHS